ncbi:hypothetical protein N7490_010812 [Penicillium lividum]|nr:hypothetical protein N7490_010812 [Penicillium lividum]
MTLLTNARSIASRSIRNAMHSPPRTLLLTFDAFDTLFHPRKPVPGQYASTAHEYGLSHCRTRTPGGHPGHRELTHR